MRFTKIRKYCLCCEYSNKNIRENRINVKHIINHFVSILHIPVFFFPIIIGLFLSGCSTNHSHGAIPQSSFYFWRSTFLLSPQEQLLIDSLHTKKLFIKVFDVDWNPYTNLPQPLAPIQFVSSLSAKVTIVPTVFITNKTFEHLPSNKLDQLANEIKNKIFFLIPLNNAPSIHEIQIDCDWSKSTQLKYFRFLETMKTLLIEKNIGLSVTIRLHQYADPIGTGVPPAPQGVLMLYNMGDVENPKTINSILDIGIAKQYLAKVKSYPLRLDIALPLYQWGVLIRRGRVVNLLHELPTEELYDSSLFKNKISNMFQACKGHYLRGVYIYPDDQIRLESVSLDQLYQLSMLLKENMGNQSFDIIFFHLEPTVEARYGFSNLRSFLRSFCS
jgi:hypothetical protein